MDSIRKLLVASVIALTIYSSSYGQGPVVTASHLPPLNPGSSFNTGAGMGFDGILFDNVEVQTFTAQQPGVLFDIGFTASRLDETTTADLRVDIATWTPANEIDQILATVFVSADTFLTGFVNQLELNTFVDFSQESVEIEQGVQYAIVFSTDVPNANFRLSGDNLGFAGGNRFDSQNGSPFETSFGESDLFFEARVVAVPELDLLGDVNMDGVVDFFDIQPFIAVLSAQTFQAEADIDGDGDVDFFDIAPFIAILNNL